MIEANENNFNELIREGIVVVDFWAPWCGPCKMFMPVFEATAKETSYKFVKVNADECERLCADLGVRSVPTIAIYKNGQLIEGRSGIMNKVFFKNWIESNI